MPEGFDYSGIISSLINGAFSLGGSAINYQYQKQLAALQNHYNLAMWNMQNEYNSPQAQMKRLESAGLNPSLMLGSINTGNAAHAPEMVTPQAPHVDKAMREFANAFNLENLRTLVAQRREAEANATSAEVDAAEKRDAREAAHDVALYYDIDKNGKYIPDSYDVQQDSDGNWYQQMLKRRTGAISTRVFHFKKILQDNFRTNGLLDQRGLLMQSQRGLNYQRGALIAPQIYMRQYDRRYYPFQYWIGNAQRGVQTIQPFLPLLY